MQSGARRCSWIRLGVNFGCVLRPYCGLPSVAMAATPTRPCKTGWAGRGTFAIVASVIWTGCDECHTKLDWHTEIDYKSCVDSASGEQRLTRNLDGSYELKLPEGSSCDLSGQTCASGRPLANRLTCDNASEKLVRSQRFLTVRNSRNCVHVRTTSAISNPRISKPGHLCNRATCPFNRFLTRPTKLVGVWNARATLRSSRLQSARGSQEMLKLCTTGLGRRIPQRAAVLEARSYLRSAK